MIISYKVVHTCINQKHSFLANIDKFMKSNEKYPGIIMLCDEYGEEWTTMVHKDLVCFYNILLCDNCFAQLIKCQQKKFVREIYKALN